MNWFEIVNKATKYIESHLEDEIVLEDIATYCNVSYSYFLKIFLMITGYTLKEYIRNRRLTVASYEVLNTHTKFIDIAVKYKYSSNEAFSRAFKKVHGMSPRDVRTKQVTTLSFFPELVYEVPTSNVKNMRFVFEEDIRFSLVGYSKHIETSHQIEENLFINTFLKEKKLSSISDSDQTIYLVKYNIEEDYKAYDLFIGFNRYEDKDIYPVKLSFPTSTYLKYSGNTSNYSALSSFKSTVFNEWAHFDYMYDGYHEVEYISEKDKDEFTVNFMVSIQ